MGRSMGRDRRSPKTNHTDISGAFFCISSRKHPYCAREQLQFKFQCGGAMRFILSLLFILGFGLYSEAVSFSSPVMTTATVTSTQVMAANGFRTYFLLVNNGSNAVIIKFGSVQTAGEGIVVPPGGSYEPIEAPSNSVFVETLTGSSSITLIQGQ